jgi:anti-sigma-K factor RskA
MTKTTHSSSRRNGWRIAVGAALATMAVLLIGLALALSSGSRDDTPRWEYLGEEYGCDEVILELDAAFEAWQSQCQGNDG